MPADPHCKNPLRGYGVEIRRDDGSTFLSSGGGGVLPAVWTQAVWAVRHKEELLQHGFTCRVVEVKYARPVVVHESGVRKRWFHPKKNGIIPLTNPTRNRPVGCICAGRWITPPRPDLRPLVPPAVLPSSVPPLSSDLLDIDYGELKDLLIDMVCAIGNPDTEKFERRRLTKKADEFVKRIETGRK